MNTDRISSSVRDQAVATPAPLLKFGLLTVIVFLAVLGSSNRALGGGFANEFGTDACSNGAGTTGTYNTGYGFFALITLTSGNDNTANGGKALNHFNKIHKGELIAALVRDSPNVPTPESIVEWASSRGLLLSMDHGTISLTV